MNTFRGILDLQIGSMLAALKAQQDRRCRDIESAVGHKADQLLAESRDRMRKRMHKAVVEERQRRETALLDARHRIETARRRRVQREYREFLQDAAPMLAAELERRWRDVESRRSWCETAIGEAAARLAGDTWTVEHPGEWSGDDTKWLERAFELRELPRPVLREDTAIVAGLRIRLGSACLDATTDGLLANRRTVEGRLLAAWERQMPEHREDANV
jgi:hypothetical protein